MVLATEVHSKVVTRQSTSVIMVSGQMCSNAFKRSLAFSFTVIISTLKQLSAIVKSFITKALKCKVVLKFKNNLYALLHIF